MKLPNLALPFANVPLNCKFKIKSNQSTGALNSLGNPVINFTEIEVSGWAIRETNPSLIATIGASPQEVPIKVWIQNPRILPPNFASFNNVKCEVTFAGVKQIGVFRPISGGHPFIPADLQFVVGAFKGNVVA